MPLVKCIWTFFHTPTICNLFYTGIIISFAKIALIFIIYKKGGNQLITSFLLPSEPSFWIQFCCFLSELKLQNVIASYRTESLTCADFLPCADVNGAEITIYADVFTVTNHDNHTTS